MAFPHEPSGDDPDSRLGTTSEQLRLEAEAGARAAHQLEALLARSAALRARLHDLRAHVGLGRRALGAVVGSTSWERMLDGADALLASRGREGRSPRASMSPPRGEAEATLAAERARMSRLARRVRAYEAGLGELARALAAGRRRLAGGAPRGLGSRDRARRRRMTARRRRVRLRPLRPQRRDRPARSLVTAIVPCSGDRDAARAAGALLRQGVGCQLAFVGRRRSFGPSMAEAIEAARTPYVLTSDAALPDPSALERMVQVLEDDPSAGAVSARVVSAGAGTAIDGACSFDWRAGAPRPIAGGVARDASSPAAVGGSCVLLRRAALAGCELPSGYRDRLWAVDLSLQLQSRGWRIRLADVVATASRLEAAAEERDVELLLERWGARLSSLVLRDLIVGGGRWSARCARVALGDDAPRPLRAACALAGWELVEGGSASPDLLIAIDDDRRVTATVCSIGVPAPAVLGSIDIGEEPAAAATLLREKLLESLDRPSVALRVPDRDERAARRGGDFYLARALARELGERGHHASVLTAGDSGRARSWQEVHITVRGRRPVTLSPGQLNLLWIISHPAEVDDAELGGADGLLVASEPYARQVSARTSTPVRPLLQFADPEVFGAAGSAGARHEILFVGNWRGVFRRAVWDARCAGFRVALVGQGWRYLAPRDVIADHVSHDQLGALYSSADVLLTDHWDDMRDAGFVSNRIFDALACGAFVISDDVAGLEALLPGGVEVYTDAEHLGRQLRRYLSDEEARRSVAERGRELVLNHHTVGSRVDELLLAVRSAAAHGARMAVEHLADQATSGDCRQSFLGAAPSEA